MSGLDQEIREGLERLSGPTPASRTPSLDRLAARRRQRRMRNGVLVAVPIILIAGLLGGIMSFGSDDGIKVTADDGERDGALPSEASRTVAVERTEVVGSDSGTARVVMQFNGALPGRDVRYIEDIASVEAGNEILYTTQDPSGVQVCGSVHWFPEPAKGTVDLLIPASWFTNGRGTHTSPLETIDNPGKFVVCEGPLNGFFQYSIWGPASAEPGDVKVTVDPDGRVLTVQIGSAPVAPATELLTIDAREAQAAEAEVRSFLDDLRRGDLESAEGRLSSYMGPTAAELLSDPVLSRLVFEEVVVTVTPSWSFTAPAPIVTASTGTDTEGGLVAAAFLVGGDRDAGGFDGGPIHRVQTVEDTPDIDATVAPGEQIVIPFLPTEGGARAHLGDLEIPVEVDYDAREMRVTYPSGTGVRILTLSAATPELPTATAFVLNVRTPTE